MIVGPHKGLFFVGTALICSASLYAAELSGRNVDPLTRIFTGEPNRLTLPPEFPGDARVVSLDEACAPQIAARELAGPTRQAASSSPVGECRPEVQPVPGEAVLPGTVSAVQPDTRAKAEAVSAGGTVQSH